MHKGVTEAVPQLSAHAMNGVLRSGF